MSCSRVTYRGWPMCSDMPPTIEMFEERMRAEQGWGSGRKLAIYQGCYNPGGVSASGGTHDMGGALDTEKLNDAGTLIARECGTTSWQRGSPEDTYFDDHNHWVWIGCSDLSWGAADQVSDYYDGRDGLADGYSDKSPRPDKIVTCQQALANYEGGGLFGMSDFKKLSRTIEQSFTGDGNWKTVRVDDEDALSILQAPKKAYSVVSGFTFDGIEVGDVVSWRYQLVDDYDGDTPTKIVGSYPIKDVIANESATCDQIMWQNDLDKSGDSKATRKLRLFIKPPNGATVRVTYVGTRALYE